MRRSYSLTYFIGQSFKNIWIRYKLLFYEAFHFNNIIITFLYIPNHYKLVTSTTKDFVPYFVVAVIANVLPIKE